MKILMLTPYLPYPPASGGQIRTLYLLKYLAQNHSITLVSLYKDEAEKEYAKHLESYCDAIHLCKRPKKPWQPTNILKAVFSDLPFLIVRNYSHEAVEKIQELLATENFDVIHAETFYIMPHIPQTDVPVLLVEQTIEYKVYQHFIASLPALIRLPLNLDIFKLKNWEKHYWEKADLVATVSESDKQEIQHIVPSIEPEIIPNGAGDEMFVSTLPTKKTDKPQLLFLGNFFWLQNVEAAQYLINEVFPKLHERLPNLELIIAGQNVSEKLTQNAHPNIVFCNLEAADEQTVKDLYHSATVFIAPIFGPGGTRLKILASMAAGLPVISTDIGVEGLGVEDGKHVLIAHSPEDFVSKTVEILQDKHLYTNIQKNAFEVVTKGFSWEAIAKKLEKVYKEVISKHSEER